MTDHDHGIDILRSGSRLYGKAARILPIEGNTVEAGAALSMSLPLLRSAMNWLEDTDDFHTAHQRLDAAGRLQRSAFSANCKFTFKDGGYMQECPVALAHSRVGLSVGAIIRESECSICRLDPDECEHIAGRIYDGEPCIQVITRAEAGEVSIVGRPNFPDARFHGISMDTRELQKEIGDNFTLGMDIYCQRCLQPCPGVSRDFERSGHAPWAAHDRLSPDFPGNPKSTRANPGVGDE